MLAHLEGAIFGGAYHIFEVKARFRGGRLLGPTFLPEIIQAIDLKIDLGQIPRSKGVCCFDMDQQSQPLIKN